MILDVLYSCNELYIEQAGVSILSLCKHNQFEFEEIRIHFIEDDISSKSKNLLRKTIEKFRASIFFYPLGQFLDSKLDIHIDSHHPVSIYSKIFCGRLPVEYRLLYIDCDCVITGSLKQLWMLDMGSSLIAGVLMPYSTNYKAYYHLEDCTSYICDGVVLFNLSLWRKSSCEDKCLSYIKSFDGFPPMLSEGTLNYVCREHILVLPPKYNMMGHLFLMSTHKIRIFYKAVYYDEDKRQEALQQPVIVHYIREFYERPWFSNSDHPKCSLYQQYKKNSLWATIKPKKGKLSKKYKFTRALLFFAPSHLLRLLGELRELKYR